MDGTDGPTAASTGGVTSGPVGPPCRKRTLADWKKEAMQQFPNEVTDEDWQPIESEAKRRKKKFATFDTEEWKEVLGAVTDKTELAEAWISIMETDAPVQGSAWRDVTAADFDITRCRRPSLDVDSAHLRGLSNCAQECCTAVENRLREQTTATLRVGPVVCSRCRRGGKTTCLCLVFDKLQAKGCRPIFISFNSDMSVSLPDTPDEDNTINALTQAIAVALLPEQLDRGDAQRVRCSKETIKQYLDTVNEDVVLLIDELNMLLKAHSGVKYNKVGEFLRTVFLDPVKRSLVFTTHVPISRGIDTLLGEGSGSVRVALFISMPRDDDLEELRSMDPSCGGLTPCEAAFYSYIPSLIYVVKTRKDTLDSPFWDHVRLAPKVDLAAVQQFLSEFFTGRYDSGNAMRHYDAFTDPCTEGEDKQVRWVLKFAGLLCEHLGRKLPSQALHSAADMIEQLPRDAQRVESGRDWEIIAHVALLLRCVEATWTTPHPLLSLGSKPLTDCDVYYRQVPQEHSETLESMVQWWQDQDKTFVTYPLLVILDPNYAKTRLIDIAWVYDTGNGCPAVRAFQDKLGKALPEEDLPGGTQGVVLRGQAPGHQTTPRKRQGWMYPGKDQILDFLGVSLRGVYPAHWVIVDPVD